MVMPDPQNGRRSSSTNAREISEELQPIFYDIEEIDGVYELNSFHPV